MDRLLIQGTLNRNNIGRWELDEMELRSGEVLEVNLQGSWIKGRIEHDGSDYIFSSYQLEQAIYLQEGLGARVSVRLH